MGAFLPAAQKAAPDAQQWILPPHVKRSPGILERSVRRPGAGCGLPDLAGPDYDRNARRPGYSASGPSASSIRSSWLYFATRSVRDGAPVLIWPAPVATAKSAIVTSSVSPERCEMTAVYPASRAIRMAASVSVSVPIWL